MLKKLTEALLSKFTGILLMSALTVTFALGTAAFNDNTAKMAEYAATMNKYTVSNDQLSSDIGQIKDLVKEVRKSSFDDKLRNLTKQIYKITKDPDDIKPVDVVSASDFCDSSLFKDHINDLTGSERIVTLSSCSQVNIWIKNSPT